MKLSKQILAELIGGDFSSLTRAQAKKIVRAATTAELSAPGITALIQSQQVKVTASDDGSSDYVYADYGDDYAAAAEDLWSGADYGDGDYCVTVQWTATDIAGHEIESGSFDLEHETEEPECPESSEHDWTSEHEGGLDENPGVWSTGGTAMTFLAHCLHCGMSRTQYVTGSQRNPGDCDTVEYGDPDPDWVAEHYAE